MNVTNLVQLFLSAKRAEGLAPRTIQTHSNQLAAFVSWLPANLLDNLASITTVTLREYINYCLNEHQLYANHPTHAAIFSSKRGLAPATINIRIRSLHALFNWANTENHLPSNPAKNIKLLRVAEDTKESLTQTQIQALLAQPDASTKQGRRDIALLLLLVDTGARVSETLSLRTEDIDLVTMQVTFRGITTKNRRTRVLPISKRTANALRVVLAESNSEYVFVTRTKHPLSYKRSVALLHQYAQQTGISVKVTPHILRHSFARNWVVQGGDPFSLQRMLGHSDIGMVRRYVQLFSQDVREKHAKYSLLS